MDASQEKSSQPRMGVPLLALIDSSVFGGVLLAAIFALSFMHGRLGSEHLSHATLVGALISFMIVVVVAWPLAALTWFLNRKRVFSSPVMLVFGLAFLNIPAVLVAYVSMEGWVKGLVIRVLSAIISAVLISKLTDQV